MDAGAAPLANGDSGDVREVTSSPGLPLDRATRSYFEPRFGRDFSGVRVHTDARASESARAIHARAYTAGQHIAFRAGEFAPSTMRGQALLAHELTHVAQTASGVIQRAPDDTSSRSTVPGGGATPGVGQGIDVTFLVMTTMSFVPDVKRYVDRNLSHEASYEITSLDELFQLLEINAASGIKVRRLRIVSHGLATGEVRIQNPRDATKHFVTPKDVAEYAKQPRIRTIVANAMAPGAVVEFWGCSIGRSQAAGEAWATLFGTAFRAQTATFRTGFNRFLRPAFKGEKGQTVKGRTGVWVAATHTDEIKNSPNQTKLDFLDWLGNAYVDLANHGDIDPLEQSKRFSFMVDLFNRSRGDLRNIQITTREGKKSRTIRPGDGEEWNNLWHTFRPQTIETVTEHPEVAPTIPDIPTDIPVKEPTEGPWLPQTPTPAPQRERADLDVVPIAEQAVRIDPLTACRLADSSPAGSLLARVPFATDSAVVPAREDELHRFIAALGVNRDKTRIRIDGYASTDGPADHNVALACERALAVSGVIINRLGIAASNVVTYAHEETAEFSARDRAANRVVILSATPGTGVEPATASLGTEPRESASATSHLGPHLLLTGTDAIRAVARVMPGAPEIVLASSMGYVRMTPGTIWDKDKMLVWATPMTTYYLVGDRLYEISTGLFLRTFWLDAFGKGVLRASHWTIIAKAEVAFLTALLVPFRIRVAVTLIDLCLTYVANKKTVDRALGIAANVAEQLYELHQRYPNYFNHLAWILIKRMGSQAWANKGELVSGFARGIQADDVAWFLGKFLSTSYEKAATTVGALIWIAAKTALTVMAVRSPKIAAQAVGETVEERIAILQDAMREEGVTMTREEAHVLLRELQAHPDTEQRLKVFQAALSDLPQALEALEKVLAKRR